jgi:ABC-type microcin C transport system permease subunit YejE
VKTATILLALLLAGCSTAPQAQSAPILVTYEGKPYFPVPAAVEDLQTGSLVAYRQRGEIVVGRIVSNRGQGVYRVEGEGLQLVHSGNYVGQLVPVAL